MVVHKLQTEAKHKGLRVDVCLAQEFSLSRMQIKKAIESGGLQIDSVVIKRVSHKLKGGEKILLRLEENAPLSLHPQSIPLNILYEDDCVLVLNKPAGLVVHPGSGHPSGTLVHALLAHCETLPTGSDPSKPGIVHRLDKGTSGVMVVAKTKEALESLVQSFKDRCVKKIYQVLLHGRISPQGTLKSKLGRHPKNRQKFSSRATRGKEAITHWKVLHYYGEAFSWVEVRLETGRTHQIRVHFSEAGHSVVGDPTYGRRSRKIDWALRPMLHALSLAFPHPQTGAEMCFTAPLAEDIGVALQNLRGTIDDSSDRK